MCSFDAVEFIEDELLRQQYFVKSLSVVITEGIGVPKISNIKYVT